MPERIGRIVAATAARNRAAMITRKIGGCDGLGEFGTAIGPVRVLSNLERNRLNFCALHHVDVCVG